MPAALRRLPALAAARWERAAAPANGMEHTFRRTALLLLCLLLAARAVAAQAAADQPAVLNAAAPGAIAGAPTRRLPKRIVLLRTSEARRAETRVPVPAAAPLDDYAVRREGGRLIVEIPWAAVRSPQLSAEGRAFTGARAEQDGDSVRLSFALRPGTNVRLAGGFNRVEIIFTAAAALVPHDATETQGTNVEPRAQGGAGEAEELRQMRAQIAALEARVRELEDRRQAAAQTPSTPAAVESAAATAQPVVAPAQPAAAAPPAAQSGAHTHDEDHHGAPTIQFQGFADVNLRASDQKGSHTSFALGQLDLFMTSRLSEKFNVLGELIVEANERNEFTFEIHRLLLQYAPNDYFHLGAGRYHTGIGYYNTAYHHGLWFQTAATRPFIFAFEGKGGILPLHNVGLTATGRVPGAPFGLHYVAEVGNGT